MEGCRETRGAVGRAVNLARPPASPGVGPPCRGARAGGAHARAAGSARTSQVPQLSGQLARMYIGFCSHSPPAAQSAHDSSSSLQTKAAAELAAAAAAAAAAAELADVAAAAAAAAASATDLSASLPPAPAPAAASAALPLSRADPPGAHALHERAHESNM